VKVQIQVHRGAEALDEGDGTTLLDRTTRMTSKAPAKLCEQGSDEGAEDATGESWIVRTAIAKWVRKSQNPLADRDLGQHTLDEVCCRFRHPSATTGGTEAAAFAREGAEAIEPARIAVTSQKAMCQHTAAEIGTQLLLDELRNGLPCAPARARKVSRCSRMTRWRSVARGWRGL